MPNDIVYILKSDIVPDELRYSLRSIEKNFPHRRVWFVCGQPKGFVPDGRIVHVQEGKNKWDLIKSSMRKVVQNDEITDDFFLFNDDFFVMRRQKGKFTNFVDGTLERRIEEICLNEGLNAYTRTLIKARQELLAMRCPHMNYDVHLPMLMNKDLVRNTIDKCSSPQMRSIYGNINRIPYTIAPDVKVYDLESVPDDRDYLSTNDKTFHEGKVGEYIREVFNKPSRFEV